jgi:hypothetical protein
MMKVALQRQRRTHLAEASAVGHCDQTDASCNSSSSDQTLTADGTWITPNPNNQQKLNKTYILGRMVNCHVKVHTEDMPAI